MATYTSTVFANQNAKGEHVGVQVVRGQFNTGATASSAGDIVFLAKIPHGAQIVDLVADHTSGSTALGISYGLASGGPAGSATFSCYVASGAQATKLRLSVLGLPAIISCSDNDPNRYGILSAKLVEAGTGTTSTIINFILTFTNDSVS